MTSHTMKKEEMKVKDVPQYGEAPVAKEEEKKENFSLSQFDMTTLLVWVVVLVVLMQCMPMMKVKATKKNLVVAVLVVFAVMKMCPWMKYKLQHFVAVHQKVLLVVVVAWVLFKKGYMKGMVTGMKKTMKKSRK